MALSSSLAGRARSPRAIDFDSTFSFFLTRPNQGSGCRFAAIGKMKLGYAVAAAEEERAAAAGRVN